jgi:hypothetical protein
MAALQTSDLHKVMVKDPAFLGVFALDRVPPTVKKSDNLKLIANLDPANKPGSHWVAIWRKGRVGQYFDSFGRRPPRQLVKWLKANCDSWTHNKVVMQSRKDKTACGYLCVSFLTSKIRI